MKNKKKYLPIIIIMSDITPLDLDSMKVSVPPKKKRGRPKKSSTRSAPEPVDIVENEEAEMKALREKLLNMADHNEELITRPINTRLNKLVNEMSLEELRARCRQGRKMNAGRIDSKVGCQVILLANMAVSQLLDCLDELNESTEDDELLNEVVSEYLSLNILDFVPDEIKIAGIYSSHVLSAYREANRRKPHIVRAQPNIEINFDEPEEVEEQVEEVDINRRDIESFIPRVQELRDRLIRMRPEAVEL